MARSASSRCFLLAPPPMLSLGWFRLRRQLTLRFKWQDAPRLVARLEVKRGGLGSSQHCPRPACQEVGNFLDKLINLRDDGRVLPPRDLSGSILARFVGKVVQLHSPMSRISVALFILPRRPV